MMRYRNSILAYFHDQHHIGNANENDSRLHIRDCLLESLPFQ
jgi:hypothetical protein